MRCGCACLVHRPTSERIQFIIENDAPYDMCARHICSSVSVHQFHSSTSAAGSSHFTRCMKNIVLIRMEREKQMGNVVRCMHNLNCIRLAAHSLCSSIELIVIKIIAFFIRIHSVSTARQCVAKTRTRTIRHLIRRQFGVVWRMKNENR